MKRTVLWAALAVSLLAGGLVAVAVYDSGGSDCPGKIVCPLTGEVICKDQCPLGLGAAVTSPETTSRCCARGN